MKDSKNESQPILGKLNPQNRYILKQFMKETPRKLNLHILSNNQKDCFSFVQHLTNVNFPLNENKLLMEQIPKK